MTKVKTAFEPAVHGFKFPNRFNGGQVVSELAAQGRLDELTGVDLPTVINGAVALARGATFWGTFGLCGGMSWVALDQYLSDQPTPAESTPPRQGSELFSRLVGRQADSLRKTDLLRKVFTWQMLSDSMEWWRFWFDNVGKLVEQREWPRLRTAIDAGHPQSICLVRSRGVGGIGNNHQVVAVGYQVGSAGQVSLDLYDPNHPGTSPKLSFHPGRGGNRINPRQSTGEPLRGFFVWPYQSP